MTVSHFIELVIVIYQHANDHDSQRNPKEFGTPDDIGDISNAGTEK